MTGRTRPRGVARQMAGATLVAGVLELRRASPRGLARKMAVFTLGVALMISLLVGGISALEVYNLNRREDASLAAVYRKMLAGDVSEHLLQARRTIDSIAKPGGLDRHPGETIDAALARSSTPIADHLEGVALIDASGTVMASSRREEFPRSLAGTPLMPAGHAESDARFVMWRSQAARDETALWITRSFQDRSGGAVAVVGRVRVADIYSLADSVAAGTWHRAALLVGPGGSIIHGAWGGSRIASSSIVYSPIPGQKIDGLAVADTQARGRMAGSWEDVTAAPELGWRVVVLESEYEALARARSALRPSLFATVLVAALAIAAALVFGRRLTAPLAEFERRAREIAAGGYVRPMELDRTDELGRLADAFDRIGVRLNSLQDMAQLLASAHDPTEVYDEVLQAIGHLVGTGEAAVLLADPEDARLVLVRGRGLREPDLQFTVAFDTNSPVAVAYSERQEVVFDGTTSDETASILRLFDAQPSRSGVAIPLIVGDEALGVLVALAPGRRRVTQAQIETLRAFSAQASVAVRLSRLFEHEHESRGEAEALREAAEVIVEVSDLSKALGRVAGVAADLLGMTDSMIALDNREEFGMEPAEDPEEERALLALWRERAVGEAGDASVFEPAVIEHAQIALGGPSEADTVPAHQGAPREESGSAEQAHRDFETLMLIPLVRADRVRGVLALSASKQDSTPGARHVALAGTLGREISLALENAALLQEARARAANLETVFRISQAVSSSLQINVVLNRVLDVVQKIFSADAVTLMAYDPVKRTMGTSMARGIANREFLYLEVAPGEDIAGAVFDTRSPVQYGDLREVDTHMARLAIGQGLRSALAVPLLARGRSIGVLTALDRRTDAFVDEDMELLLTFASQAALAIDTASLYGREHHVASVLQSSILPERLPVMRGLETGSFYLPAGMDAEIGGDYYDLFATGDGSAVIAIGDVCGKGVQAATKTSMIKYFLRGMIAAGAGPGQALSELNRIVSGTGDPSDIVTAWVGIVDPARRSFLYADGGHPPALLYRRSSRKFERLEATGPLLGAIEDAPYDERVIRIEPGDLLLTYTDGVTEARRGNRFFGEGRVRRVMRRSESAQGAADQLLEAVAKFSSGVMRDDAAVLAIRIVEPLSQDEGLGQL